jgi:hypothetical protein
MLRHLPQPSYLDTQPDLISLIPDMSPPKNATDLVLRGSIYFRLCAYKSRDMRAVALRGTDHHLRTLYHSSAFIIILITEYD